MKENEPNNQPNKVGEKTPHILLIKAAKLLNNWNKTRNKNNKICRDVKVYDLLYLIQAHLHSYYSL